MDGVVLRIQRYCIHDGPGIRTSVFLKGCSLRCLWCHNPESWQSGLTGGASHAVDPFPARRMNVSGVLEEIEKDIPFFDESGGGVTFTGGEPMMQAEFLLEALKALSRQNLHVAVDTSGYAPWEHFEAVLPYCGLFLYDLKHMDEARHIECTGVSNALILRNLEQLAVSDAKLIVRIPVIPGINMDKRNMDRTSAFLKGIGIGSVELLPYHSHGAYKYGKLALNYRLEALRPPDAAAMNGIVSAFLDRGLQVMAGGVSHDGKSG